MATIWSKLGKLGPAWVVPGVGLAFTFIVLVFGYLFETTYYAAFGVGIENHVSRTYFAGSPFRYPVTFSWAVLLAFVFFVNLSLLSDARSIKQGGQQLFLLAAMLVGSYLVVSGDAKEHAETLRPIEIASSGDEGTPHSYLLVGDIGSELIVCDPKDGSVEIIENPRSIRFPKSADTKVDAKRCWHSEFK